jgi:hypothetical protein
MKNTALFLLGLCAFSLYAEDRGPDEIARIDPELSVIKRADSLPEQNLKNASDTYLEGYIQALIDAHYYEYNG